MKLKYAGNEFVYIIVNTLADADIEGKQCDV